MSFHGVKEFAEFKANLAQLFVSTAAQFASNCGLENMDEIALYHQLSMKLEDMAGEVLMFGNNAWPTSAQPDLNETPALTGPDRESFPSETDPPVRPNTALFYTLGALLIAAPLSFILSLLIPNGGAVFYLISIMSVSLILGSRYAVILALIAPVLHNLIDIVPRFAFTAPDRVEWLAGIAGVLLALGLPSLVRACTRLRQSVNAPPSPPSSVKPTFTVVETYPLALAA